MFFVVPFYINLVYNVHCAHITYNIDSNDRKFISHIILIMHILLHILYKYAKNVCCMVYEKSLRARCHVILMYLNA